MKKQIMSTMILLALTSSAFALDDLVPATNEDMAAFDKQLSGQRAERTQKAEKQKSHVTNAIAEEAKKLKDASKEDRKQFGKWVSDQKRKNEQGRPDSAGIDKGGAKGGGKGSDSAGEARGRSAEGGGQGRGRNK